MYFSLFLEQPLWAFYTPQKKCTGIIKWQKTWSMFRACVVVISGKNLLLVFWGMTVHVCHSLLYTYIYMFQIGIICISTDCRHFELALEMMKCWLFQWPPMATYIFKLSSLSFSSTEKQYCSTMMIDYWKVAVISDCLQSPVNTKQWMGIFWHVKKNNNEKKREQTWYPTASKHFQLARQIKFQSHKSCFN